jgi:hypothetical protein
VVSVGTMVMPARGRTSDPPMAASRYEFASQSDGLGFRGVLGRENASLTEELTAELAGILSWSLDGLDRLTRQGKFTELKSPPTPILALQDFVSPVAAFVRDRCRSALVTRSRLRTFRRLALVVRGQRTQAGVGPDLRT